MLADVARAQSAQDGVGQRVQGDVGIGMSGQRLVMGDPQAAEIDVVARAEAVHVEAAADAGCPAPEIAAGFPIWVTDDADAARANAAQTFLIYGQLPSYRAMLDREGVDGVEDLIVAGDEARVRAQIARLAEAGATDLCVFPFGPDEASIERTIDLLGAVARGA